MNIVSRESLNDYSISRQDGNINRVNNFTDIKRFLSVGYSTIYTAVAQVDGRNGIVSGDTVYFKINNEIGVNEFGRIDESSGSCEDVAEVMSFYALRNLQRTLGTKCVLKPTPYDFADYEHDDFFDVIAKKTNHFVESDRRYGCISKNCISSKGEIIHGDNLLSLVVPNKNVLKSSSNTLYNYDTALGELALASAKHGQEVIINPISTRYLANTMFWDYFISNSDRHCRNINFEKIALEDGRFLITPLAIIDNGGGLCMQSSNCRELFEQCSEEGSQDGKTYSSSSLAPFNVPYDFNVGKDSFPDGDFKDAYEDLEPSEQIVALISGNRTLYNDFANMYKNLDFKKALTEMRLELRFKEDFLPNLGEIVTGVLNLKKLETSKSMANFMHEGFNYETFLQNPNYYVDKFAEYVTEDNLNLHIATDEEVEEFNIAFGLSEEQEIDTEQSEVMPKPTLDVNKIEDYSLTEVGEQRDKTGDTNESLVTIGNVKLPQTEIDCSTQPTTCDAPQLDNISQ